MSKPKFTVEWSDAGEYVARVEGREDISGHSREALYALRALTQSLSDELGHQVFAAARALARDWRVQDGASLCTIEAVCDAIEAYDETYFEEPKE